MRYFRWYFNLFSFTKAKVIFKMVSVLLNKKFYHDSYCEFYLQFSELFRRVNYSYLKSLYTNDCYCTNLYIFGISTLISQILFFLFQICTVISRMCTGVTIYGTIGTIICIHWLWTVQFSKSKTFRICLGHLRFVLSKANL